MAAHPTIPERPDCPAWCRVDHRHVSAAFHAYCAGELHWNGGGIVVSVTRPDSGDGVELGYYANGEAPAIAFLSRADVHRLRDFLEFAESAMDKAL